MKGGKRSGRLNKREEMDGIGKESVRNSERQSEERERCSGGEKGK